MSKECGNLTPEHQKYHQAISRERQQKHTLKRATQGDPSGWGKLHGIEVYTDGVEFVLLGDPVSTGDDEKDCDLHNCDSMGCRLLHVLYRGKANWINGCNG